MLGLSTGRHNAGVVAVKWYSHFSGSETESISFSVPQLRRSYVRNQKMSEYTSIEYYTYSDTAFWSVPAARPSFVELLRVVLRRTDLDTRSVVP